LQSLTQIDLGSMEYYSFQVGTFAGINDIIISATGYTGAGGFEIYFPNAVAEQMWNAIFEAGKDFGIKPIGLGARDTLRLEMGFCLYGNDINDETSPLEAGLGWITKFTKDFIDKDYLLKQKEAGLTRKLVGFEMIDRGIARQHCIVKDENGNEMGEVTSGTQSPTSGKIIGMAYVATPFSKVGTEIYMDIRGKLMKAVVTKAPFIQK